MLPRVGSIARRSIAARGRGLATAPDRLLLIRGGTVVTADDEFPGDVLCKGEHIAAVRGGGGGGVSVAPPASRSLPLWRCVARACVH